MYTALLSLLLSFAQPARATGTVIYRARRGRRNYIQRGTSASRHELIAGAFGWKSRGLFFRIRESEVMRARGMGRILDDVVVYEDGGVFAKLCC